MHAIYARLSELALARFERKLRRNLQVIQYKFNRFERAVGAMSVAADAWMNDPTNEDLRKQYEITKEYVIVRRGVFINSWRALGVDHAPGREIVFPEIWEEKLVRVVNRDTGLTAHTRIRVKQTSKEIWELNDPVEPEPGSSLSPELCEILNLKYHYEPTPEEPFQ